MLDTLKIFGSTVITPSGILFPSIIAVLIVLAIASIFGNIGIDWKNRKFIFGNQNRGTSNNKRSCNDCIMLLLGKGTIYQATYGSLKSNILRDQMTYVENKIQDIRYMLEGSYREDIKFYRKEENPERENKEFTLYQELLSNSMYKAKDEVRRSFKENGFHTMSEIEFNLYVKEKSKTIITIVREYLRRNNPVMGMIVPQQERFKRIDDSNTRSLLEGAIQDVYENASEVRHRIDKELSDLQYNFVRDIDMLTSSGASLPSKADQKTT